MVANIGVFIFRRDLRIHDNHGLEALGKRCKNVIPIFVLDESQIERNRKNQSYFCNNAVQFLCESLNDLDKELRDRHGSKLRLFYGSPESEMKLLLQSLLRDYSSVVVGWNADFSPYSLKRDQNIIRICESLNVEVIVSKTDYTLIPFDKLIKNDGTAFKQFGAFYKHAILEKPLIPAEASNASFVKLRTKVSHEYDGGLERFYDQNPNIAQRGGRAIALQKLQQIVSFRDYESSRNLASVPTTGLSGALNFGCISVREVYYAITHELGEDHGIVRQLYWRDFYLQAVLYIERANDWTKHIDERFSNLPWKNNVEDWKRLMDGQTGFLLVDAGIMQMKTTGFIHGRIRMILGFMWTKYLLIDSMHPHYGSQVGFSKYLVDAVGPSQNLMNHRWILDFDYPGKKYSAANAPLSGRPMDISNKMIKKWDPSCAYIKTWLPHLKDVPEKDLRRWNAVMSKKYNNIHPGPMFDAKEKYKEWVEFSTYF